MAFENIWQHPPLAIFFVWGFGLAFFLVCIPIRSLLQMCCVNLGCMEPPPTREESIADANERRVEFNNSLLIPYKNLSRIKQIEMDARRNVAISNRLRPYSMFLQKEHMLTRLSEVESHESPQPDKSNEESANPNDENEATFESEEKPETDINNENDDITDIEQGLGTKPSIKEEDPKESKTDDVGYTHISIPYPGYNRDGEYNIITKETLDDGNKQGKKNKSKLFDFFTRKTKVDVKETTGTTDEESNNDDNNNNNSNNTNANTNSKNDTDNNNDNNNSIRGKDERRQVPIFCAICLVEYETSDMISWSSNPDCTHYFHFDCVRRWLVTVGKNKSRVHPGRLVEEDTLNYCLECPCCRQEFVKRDVIDGDGGSNVSSPVVMGLLGLRVEDDHVMNRIDPWSLSQ